MGSRFEGDGYFAGSLSAKTLVPSAGCVTDSSVAALAGVSHTKLEHQHRVNYSQANVTAVDETKAIFVAYAAGSVLDFRAGMIGPNVGASTVTFDLKKNGTTVLTSAVSLSSSNAAYEDVAGTVVGSTTFVQGDVFTVVCDATVGGGTLGTGPFASMTVSEAAQ